MDNPTPLLLAAVAADLASEGLKLDVGLFDPQNGAWVAGTATATPPRGFDAGDLVLVLPGREIALAKKDEGLDMVALIDAVSDWAMDELGYGWPELADHGGGFVAIMRPAADGGRVVWEGGGRRVPVGKLSTVPLVARPTQKRDASSRPWTTE